jgi:hypothetical protein
MCLRQHSREVGEVGGGRWEVGGGKGHVTRQHKNGRQQRLDQRVIQHGEYAEAVHVAEEESRSYNRNG